MKQEAKAKSAQKTNKADKKSIYGRTTQISMDAYERAKKDAKYRKMTVDQYLDSLLREVIFKPAKPKGSKKQDLLGYCPNCGATIKKSTIKLDAPKIDSHMPVKPAEGFFAKLFKKKTD